MNQPLDAASHRDAACSLAGPILLILGAVVSKSSSKSLPCTWVMFQRWAHLLWLSYPIPVETMRGHIPDDLEIDTYDGSAWLTVLPMYMEDLHIRFLPPIPGTSNFPEINLRTYVTVGAVSGVYLFTVDSASCLGSFIARHVFNVPYVYAKMSLTQDGDTFRMESRRKASGRFGKADFVGSYRPVGDPKPA